MAHLKYIVTVCWLALALCVQGQNDRARRYELPRVENQRWLLEYTEGCFTLEYDTLRRHPKWVAWQLHSGMYGPYNRSEAWHFDPRVKAYGITRSDFQKQHDFQNPERIISYDRGHLCPSGDRKASEAMNAETFVYSNMSPQLGAFNQGIWAKLEAVINRWGQIPGDTLYICAGGTIQADSCIAAYTSPSGMAIPKHYFKVVLRSRGGQWQAIGFWLEHRDYGRKNSDLTAALDAIILPVDEIERRTGIDFFYFLPATVQNKAESSSDRRAWKWD